MGYSKTIVCLANSRKPPSGRCVAGREMAGGRIGAWIRPVSARSSREISEEERRYENGGDPKLLDLVRIQFARHEPEKHQQENHVIDDEYYWERKSRASWQDIQGAIDSPGQLWLNHSSSSYGQNDRVAEDQAAQLTTSLYLIRPDSLSIAVASEGGDFGPPRRRVRARFQLQGTHYCFVVTDPWVERQYLAKSDGVTSVDEALLCVSLTEPFHGYAYKLVAAVITPDRAGA